MTKRDPIFVTGIGTGIGKTVVSAIIAKALGADYWKPVQAGYDKGTDTEWVQKILMGTGSIIYPETYRLKMAASPHIAARMEELHIDLHKIASNYGQFEDSDHRLIIEGAGGLVSPLNEREFVIDLIKMLNARVILVSKNYLGSINHSLLTAEVCKQKNLNVAGWIFVDQYLDYEDEIAAWSGFQKIASIPFVENPDAEFIHEQGMRVEKNLKQLV